MGTRKKTEFNIGGNSMKEGWMLPTEVFQWLHEHIPAGSSILEFGSGNGSTELSKKYDLISVEHDLNWLGISSGTYIHAEIVQNQISNKFSELGWYDFEKLANLPPRVDVIIIDGPPGEIGRSGLLGFLSKLPLFTWMIVDDTDRLNEKHLSIELIRRLSPIKTIEITSKINRHNGAPRKAMVLLMR